MDRSSKQAENTMTQSSQDQLANEFTTICLRLTAASGSGQIAVCSSLYDINACRPRLYGLALQHLGKHIFPPRGFANNLAVADVLALSNYLITDW